MGDTIKNICYNKNNSTFLSSPVTFRIESPESLLPPRKSNGGGEKGHHLGSVFGQRTFPALGCAYRSRGGSK